MHTPQAKKAIADSISCCCASSSVSVLTTQSSAINWGSPLNPVRIKQEVSGKFEAFSVNLSFEKEISCGEVELMN